MEPRRLSPEESERMRQEALHLRSANPIQQSRIDATKRDVQRVIAAFDPEKTIADNPIFPEQLFRQCGFKDFFYGVVEDTIEYQFENKWITIAGSATAEVNIVDSAGQILFTVPPLYDTSYLRIGNYRRDDMLSEIGQNFASKASNNGYEADAYLAAALEAKLQNIVGNESTQVSRHAAMLEKMYAYYGERPKNTSAVAVSVAVSAKSNIHDDFDID